MPLSERKKAHQDDAPQSVHNLTEVSKNAFVEPFSAPQNYVKNHPKNLGNYQTLSCIFAVRGFIDSLCACNYCRRFFIFKSIIKAKTADFSTVFALCLRFYIENVTCYACRRNLCAVNEVNNTCSA